MRQEVLNVVLAQELQRRGLVSLPESNQAKGQGRQLPDVVVIFNGLRVAIEGEVDDQPNAALKARNSAALRVEQGIAHVGVGVVYPTALRHSFTNLGEDLSNAALSVVVVTESGDDGPVVGDVDYLGNAIRRAADALSNEQRVAEAVTVIDEAIDVFARAVEGSGGSLARLAATLGVRELGKGVRRSSGLTAEQEAATARIGGLVLLNAMVFQEMLSEHEPSVQTIASAKRAASFPDSFSNQWQRVMDEINYYPIFNIASDVLRELQVGPDVKHALLNIAGASQRIVSMRAALRHDLMGRVYHRLLSEAKYLATYYTKTSSAAILLSLTIADEEGRLDWSSPEEVAQVRVCDFACGTGTLLMAAIEAIADMHVRTSVANGKAVDFNGLHKRLTEDVVYGFDVLASAIHLTASTMSMRLPESPVDKTNLYALQLGGPLQSLGSLDFLAVSTLGLTSDLFTGHDEGAERVSGKTKSAAAVVKVPRVDFCVMNPPYARSVGGNLLFGSVPEAERTKMQSRLKSIIKGSRVPLQCSVTAGLGSPFIAMADKYITEGGKLSLVLPKAVLSGVEWAPTRNLLSSKYEVQYIVSSQDPSAWNFSESTSMSEVLIVAKKVNRPNPEHQVQSVSLWENPQSVFKALATGHQITQGAVPSVNTPSGALSTTNGGQKTGECIGYRWGDLRSRSNWAVTAAFAQVDLVRMAHWLERGFVWAPGVGEVGKIPIASLGDMATLGPDRRDIHDGFVQSSSPTPYPAFWGHSSEAVRCISQTANGFLEPLTKAKTGRNLRSAEVLWPRAGSLLIVERMRLNSQRMTAVTVPTPVLSNTWWPVSFRDDDWSTKGLHKALAVWLNSSYGMLLVLANRSETEGSWVEFRKPIWAAMPVLDVVNLDKIQSDGLVRVYDEVCQNDLDLLSEVAADSTRQALDRGIAEVFGLPEPTYLWTALGREPVLTNKAI